MHDGRRRTRHSAAHACSSVTCGRPVLSLKSTAGLQQASSHAFQPCSTGPRLHACLKGRATRPPLPTHSGRLRPVSLLQVLPTHPACAHTAFCLPFPSLLPQRLRLHPPPHGRRPAGTGRRPLPRAPHPGVHGLVAQCHVPGNGGGAVGYVAAPAACLELLGHVPRGRCSRTATRSACTIAGPGGRAGAIGARRLACS